MLKTRKRWISIMLTLSMLVAFCGVLPVGAAANPGYVSSEITTVQDDTENAALGTVQISIDPLRPGTHEAWVSLPSGYDINSVTITGTTTTVTAVYDALGDDSFKLTVTNSGANADADIFIEFDKVDVPSGEAGEVLVTFENIRGQLSDGSAVIAKVSGGAVKLAVTDSGNFSEDGGETEIRFEETVAGTLESGDTVDLTLPDGFEWGNVVATRALYGKKVGGVAVVASDLSISGVGSDKLQISLKSGVTTEERAAFEFTVEIEVSDEDDADFGDVVAKVKGDYDANVSEITVGKYGDYGGDIKAKDTAPTIYAGKNEQDVSDITIEEGVKGSLVHGRTVTLQLPENARWVLVNDTYVNPDTDLSDLQIGDAASNRNSGIQLTYSGLSGTDDRTLKLKVDAGSNNIGSTDAAELTIDDIQVALQAGVTGDLVVNVGGSAGLTGEITLAKVVAPVTVTAEKTNVQIGKFGQAAGDITITETAAGAINEEDLIITLPNDVVFDGDPDVSVTSGDLKIGDVDTDENSKGDDILKISIKSDSSEASTIKVTGIKYAINRVLPEGDIKVKVGGEALVETNIETYYDGTDFEVKKSGEEEFFDTGSVATIVNATCITPGGAGTSGTAVFRIGEPSYTLNGDTISMDVAPYIKSDRTYMPIRFAANALGVPNDNISWDDASKKATIMSGDRVVQVTVGSTILIVNGASIATDAAPEIVSERIMVPIRFLGQALGANFVWDEAAQTVTVIY